MRPTLPTPAADPGSAETQLFVAALVHELRTPLNSILGFTGSLLMRLPGPLTPEQERQLLLVERGASHLRALVDELLELAQSRAVGAQCVREPLLVHELVQSVLDLLQPIARAKGLRLTARLPAGPVECSSDRRALTRILLNLVGNALKFSAQGEVRVECERDESGLRLAVVDSGPGIASADQERLFQPFERLQDASTEGSGLGLYHSQQLAHLLGGRIRCVSSPGNGARFELWLS